MNRHHSSSLLTFSFLLLIDCPEVVYWRILRSTSVLKREVGLFFVNFYLYFILYYQKLLWLVIRYFFSLGTLYSFFLHSWMTNSPRSNTSLFPLTSVLGPLRNLTSLSLLSGLSGSIDLKCLVSWVFLSQCVPLVTSRNFLTVIHKLSHD